AHPRCRASAARERLPPRSANRRHHGVINWVVVAPRESPMNQAAQPQALVFKDKEELRQELKLADPAAIHAETGSDPALDQQAEDVVARIMKLDLNDSAAQAQTKAAVETLGLDLQKEAARRSAMLKQPLTALMKQGDEGGEVAKT